MHATLLTEPARSQLPSPQDLHVHLMQTIPFSHTSFDKEKVFYLYAFVLLRSNPNSGSNSLKPHTNPMLLGTQAQETQYPSQEAI